MRTYIRLFGALLLAAAMPCGAQEAVADPAVWGPYAQWVDKTFERQQEKSPYGAHRVTYAWQEPGKVMLETGYYEDGRVWFTQAVTPGNVPGELTSKPRLGPKGTWKIVDPQTLASNTLLGYQTIRRATGAGSYEEQTLKGNQVEDRRTYLDTASGQYQAREEEKAGEQARKRAEAIAALRAAGVPDEPAAPAPADHVLAYQEPVRGPAAGLQLTRGKSLGASCHVAVYINDRLAARLVGSETASFNVPAGPLRIVVGADPTTRATCRMGESGMVEHLTVLGRGERLHVHFKGSDNAVRFSEALLGPAAP